jgi:hypothetical protein
VVAVNQLGIAPSEARNMTVHEIVALMEDKYSDLEDTNAELYDMYIEAKNGNSKHP